MTVTIQVYSPCNVLCLFWPQIFIHNQYIFCLWVTALFTPVKSSHREGGGSTFLQITGINQVHHMVKTSKRRPSFEMKPLWTVENLYQVLLRVLFCSNIWDDLYAVVWMTAAFNWRSKMAMSWIARVQFLIIANILPVAVSIPASILHDGHKELLCLWIEWPECVPEHSLSCNVEVKSMCLCSHVDVCIYGVVPTFVQTLKWRKNFITKKKIVACVAPRSLNIHWL